MVFDEKKYYQEFSKAHGWGEGVAKIDPERAMLMTGNIVGKSVLDVGCATGKYVDYLAGLGYEAWGIDFVPEFITYAKKNNRGKFVKMDALALDFKGKSFDTVLAFDILEHLDDGQLLDRIKSLKPKRVIAVVPRTTDQELSDNGLIFRHHLDRTHARTYSKENLTDLFNTNGFKVREIRELHPVHLKQVLDRTYVLGLPIFSRIFFKILFTLLSPFQRKAFNSELMVVADL